LGKSREKVRVAESAATEHTVKYKSSAPMTVQLCRRRYSKLGLSILEISVAVIGQTLKIMPKGRARMCITDRQRTETTQHSKLHLETITNYDKNGGHSKGRDFFSLAEESSQNACRGRSFAPPEERLRSG
jgi:hypothetical protein